MVEVGHVLTFIEGIPRHIEQARRSLLSANASVLEEWHMRLQTEINLLTALRSRIQNQQQRDDARRREQDRFAQDITVLLNEAMSAYQNVDDSLLDGRSILSFSEEGSLSTDDETHQVQSGGRPRKEISKDDIERCFEVFRSWKLVANLLGISVKTLRRRRAEYGLQVSSNSGPRVTFSPISQDQLCDVVRNILLTLPDIGESMVMGALRARGLNVQRRRVRDAIMEVDPMSRALRRTTAVIRREYSVPSPNSLWYVLHNSSNT